ncbi:MAG: GvpL/GvpF family gas vesicle protein [Candidatus Bipolaricaulota bacterium]
MSEIPAGEQARYLYCVADSGRDAKLGHIGLEDDLVYCIPQDQEGICAVVHDCSPEPYESGNQEVVKDWIRQHQRVLDGVRRDDIFSGLIPAGFDTIIKAKEGHTAPETVRQWLLENAKKLRRQLGQVKNKEEYGVQIFYEPDRLTDQLFRNSAEIKSLQNKIQSESEGAAYLYREKLNKLIKDKLETKKESFIADFTKMISPKVQDWTREKKGSREERADMLVNLCCLVEQGQHEELGAVLEEIDDRKGFSV